MEGSKIAIEHNVITDPEIHEPKGASTATSNTTYVSDGAASGSWTEPEPKGVSSATAGETYIADGAGSGAWEFANPHGGIYYVDLATPYALAATTSYQKAAPVTTTTHLHDFTNSGTGRLTYTGADSRHVHMVANFSVDQSSGANRDVTLALFKNGVEQTGSTVTRTTSTGDKGAVVFHFDDEIVTNDYLEVYAKISTASTVNFYTFYMFVMGMPS